MYVTGCDIGSQTAKAVLLQDSEILGHEIIPLGLNIVQSAIDVMNRVLDRFHLGFDEISYCVSTGYGRETIPFAQENVSELSCHGKGAHFLKPSVRTIIDIGGQDYKAICINNHGVLTKFLMNSKCVAGAGKSLEEVARCLGVHVSELGPLSLQATDPVVLHVPCTILTEIKIRHLLLDGKEIADIAAGANIFTAKRVLKLLRGLRPEEDFVVTGGLAKNTGLIKSLEMVLNKSFVHLPEDPQIVGALGAAVFAYEKMQNTI